MKQHKLKTTPEISKRMSKLKSERNKVETKLAKALWNKGYRYRLNYKKLPGSPDIVLTKYAIAIFVDGEFWHGKDFENQKKHIKNNNKYWVHKIENNINRDKKNDTILRQTGWITLHFWSRDIENNLDECLQIVDEFVQYQKDGI